MTRKNQKSPQGSFNLYGKAFIIAEDIGTGEASKISAIITQKKIKADYFRKKARNGKLEISYSQGVLMAEIVDISPSNRRYWRISLIPIGFLPIAA